MLDKIQIRYAPLDSLIPYSGNSRTHSDEQVNEIANSIKKNGWTNPVLLDGKNGIIAGHGRLLAAIKLGLGEVPAIDLSFASDAQKAAYIIADNKIALNAGWDYDILNVQFDLIEDAGIDLSETGFNEEDISAIRNPEKVFDGLCDEDDAPGISVEVISKLNDVWVLGSHRLMCGDSTMIDSVQKLMDGEKAKMIFTDPPYGVNFKQGKFIGREKKGKDRDFDPILNDDKQGNELKEFLQECFSNIMMVVETAVIYAWSHPLLESFSVLNSLIDSGWHIQSQIIWNKTPFVIGRADYHWKHEVCWYGYIGEKHQWHGGRDKSTVWDCNKIQSSDLHPTMKPVELAEMACSNSTRAGDIVLDIFGGSGSTLIACEKTNRKCYMMELSPQYCDVIIRRWEKFSGNQAILESTQQTFDEVSNG